MDTRPASGAPPALATERPATRSLLDIFAATVAHHGDRQAIDAGADRLSYRELAAAAGALADRLRLLHIGPGDRVGVRVPSGSADLYVAILGVLRAGAAYVPVDADDPPARAQAIWDACGACAVIGAGQEVTPLAPAGGSERGATADDDAWIIFTSGSTGEPKGVAVTHRSAAAFVDAETALWRVGHDDRVLAGLSVGFDASCEEMWLAWRNGAALVPAPRAIVRTGTDLGPWMAGRGVTVVSTVPTLASMWDDDVLRGVRLLILGGEACSPELGWRLAAHREVWNTYGPTEATVVTTAARVVRGRPVTIGWPLAGWKVAVVGPDGEPVRFGEAGELAIGGVGLARYLDPRLDAERYAGLPSLGWERAYRSGDTVRETPDGLEFVGRRDHQVKIGGRRLELGEVEARLSAVPGVRSAAAVVRTTAGRNTLLVGYVAGDVDPMSVRAHVAEHLPDGLSPLIVVLDELPLAGSGKVDRKALPWPPPDADTGGPDPRGLSGTAAWLAERWTDQLGPLRMTPETDFFRSGGSSLAVAKLVSILRARFPSVAVADVYEHRTLGALAARLQALGEARPTEWTAGAAPHRRWGVVRLLGVLVMLGIGAGQWLVAAFAYNDVVGDGLPRVGWWWIAGAWLLLASPMARTGIVLVANRVLISRLPAGRHSRHSWPACRVWFVERLTEVCNVGRLAGTPLAERYARLSGADVGAGARLGTIPAASPLVSIGAGATLESDVDLKGWWIDGQELVLGEVRVGAGARVGTRALLMPGTVIGDGAEIEPGAVVSGVVPAGERWAGAPARHVGAAGIGWPEAAPEPAPRARAWKAMIGAGLAAESLLPLIAFAPAVLVFVVLGLPGPSLHEPLAWLPAEALLLTTLFLVSYALLMAAVLRAVGRLIRPGWQADNGATAWALWFGGNVMASAQSVLFPLFSSLYTRRWLRLMGLDIGRRAEISTVVGLNRHVRFGELSFAADDVVMCNARARAGWLHVAPIAVGDRTFLGNGAMLWSDTAVGDACLVGVLTAAPRRSADGTSWFGTPALELPRRPDATDPARTTDPPRRLVLARGVMDLIRLLAPSTASAMLGWLVFLALEDVGTRWGAGAMILAAPLALVLAALAAVALTVAAKWLVIGRYRPGEHPLWSFFVWRDELINSTQEQLAGAWLMSFSIGTPLMSLYLRALGAKVGRDVWCETLAITEFDLVDLGDGCAINRRACLETHLFHDRLMRIGPSTVGAGATVGPSSAVLPDTSLGAGSTVGGRSVVLRGETIPAGTRWHGAPVVAM